MRTWLVLAFALVVGGCTTAPTREPAADPERAWQARRADLAGLEQWRLTGRIAIRTEGEGWHATLDWRQDRRRYDIRLIGPLGQGTVRLQGGPGRVSLQTEDGQTTAADPEWLLYRNLGWRVPVEALRYWVLGLPAPGSARERELDRYGRLARLEQADWRIEFRDYERRGGYELPSRIFVRNHRAQVRLVVGQWRLSQPQGEPG
ncbi:MAG TPA: lipoprotein insertase outer membrane protein LolB [Gammaproteobacteria bacterium]|nr:lipoprotein insertase outer membrane protein LolB [Gammaproteobacteria bacterium]